MKTGEDELEARVERLLSCAGSADRPLHRALAELYQRYREHVRLIERVTRGDETPEADGAPGNNYALRYRRELRQIEKIIRISDHYQHMMRDMNQKLRVLSDRDELTALPNRRYMNQRLNEALRAVGEHGKPFCVALADIDYFKRINDSYGHDVGDLAFTAVARTLSGSIRECDLCARWGGEEFLLLLPMTGLSEAQRVLERLRRKVGAIEGVLPPGAPGMTISFGVTVCREESEMPETLLRRTDQALYRAKSLGRNRVETG